MAAFKFNLQQLDLLGAYDRYTKELETRKKEELYENKLVEQEVDNFVKYYNPKSLRESDSPLLYNEFKNYETAAKALNRARRTGNVDEINKYRKSMQDATVNMGDLYSQSTIAKKVAADLAVLKDQERKGLIAIDDKDYTNKFKLFTTGSLDDIKKSYGKADTWGSVMTGVEYDNNKYNENLSKTITAFNSNKNNYITGTAPVEYQKRTENGVEFQVPVFEKVPDYNKALQLAIVQPESMKKKLIQQLNAELAQGGTISDIARIKQDKVAKIFGKTPDQLTADDLLAYSIAGDSRKEADFKQGKATWQMKMEDLQFEYKKKIDADRLKVQQAKAAASKSSKEGKISGAQLTAFKSYYSGSKDIFVNPGDGELNPKKINEFNFFLNGVSKEIKDFMHKSIPATKDNPTLMNRALKGYLKDQSGPYANMNP